MASARVRNGRFIGLYRDADGGQRSAGTYPTKREALKAAQLAELGVMPVMTEFLMPEKIRGKVTVAAYAAEWLPSHPVSPRTREVYEQILRKHIIPALGARTLADVTSADVRQMFRTMEADKTSRALLAKVKTVMSAMFQTASEDRKIPANPVRGVRFQASPPKRRRAMTADEWHRVRRYLRDDYRLLADIVMATGCRIEEALGMETEDINRGVWHVQRVRNELKAGFVTVDKTKTGRTREVPMDPAIVRRIKATGPGRVFPDIPSTTYRKAWRAACKAAGLDWRPAPRDLRRTFATLAREGGADLEAVRVALGHARLATTDIYLDERPDTRTDALLAVQKALRGAG
jgi:integrase